MSHSERGLQCFEDVYYGALQKDSTEEETD